MPEEALILGYEVGNIPMSLAIRLEHDRILYRCPECGPTAFHFVSEEDRWDLIPEPHTAE